MNASINICIDVNINNNINMNVIMLCLVVWCGVCVVALANHPCRCPIPPAHAP